MWIVLLIVGLLVGGITTNSISKGKKSKDWPSAEAIVISTEVEERHEYDEDGESVTYYPHVVYNYHVGGTHFEGNHIKLLESSMVRSKAYDFISNYNPDDQITIFYNPNKPGESVIQTGEQKYLYAFLVISIGLVVFFCGEIIVINCFTLKFFEF